MYTEIIALHYRDIFYVELYRKQMVEHNRDFNMGTMLSTWLRYFKTSVAKNSLKSIQNSYLS